MRTTQPGLSLRLRRLWLLAFALVACASPAPPAPSPRLTPASGPASAPAKVVVAAVGDILLHIPVKEAVSRRDKRGAGGESENHGGYDTLFDRVLPAFGGADIVFGNLESPVAPKSEIGTRPLVFNAPLDLLDAMLSAGFTVVSFANNHVYDQGRPGFEETLSHLEERGLAYAGAGRSEDEAFRPRVIEKAGVKICLMGLARLLNRAESQPDSPKEPQIAYIPYGDKEAEGRAVKKVAAARRRCDFLLVSVHWGSEYTITPRGEDKALAKKLIDAGADGILGHHPHVLQPLEEHEAKDGRRAFVAYSLSNFVSHQDRAYPQKASPLVATTRDSMVLKITIAAEGGAARLDSVGFYPAWIDRVATPPEWSEGPPPLIRAALVDEELALAEAALAAPQNAEARRAWTTRKALLEERRAAISAIVGERYLLPAPSLAEAERPGE